MPNSGAQVFKLQVIRGEREGVVPVRPNSEQLRPSPLPPGAPNKGIVLLNLKQDKRRACLECSERKLPHGATPNAMMSPASSLSPVFPTTQKVPEPHRSHVTHPTPTHPTPPQPFNPQLSASGSMYMGIDLQVRVGD